MAKQLFNLKIEVAVDIPFFADSDSKEDIEKVLRRNGYHFEDMVKESVREEIGYFNVKPLKTSRGLDPEVLDYEPFGADDDKTVKQLLENNPEEIEYQNKLKIQLEKLEKLKEQFT